MTEGQKRSEVLKIAWLFFVRYAKLIGIPCRILRAKAEAEKRSELSMAEPGLQQQVCFRYAPGSDYKNAWRLIMDKGCSML